MKLTPEEKAKKRNLRKEKIQKRVWEIDALRGLAILSVLWDHFMFDAAFVFDTTFYESGNQALINFADFASKYYFSDLRLYARPFFVFIFFFVAGLCTILSKNNGIRGFKLLIVALIVTLLTYLAEIIFKTSGILIAFGVLHCLAICMLIFAGINFIINKATKDNKHKKWIKFGIYGTLSIIVLVIDHFYNISMFDKSDIFPTHSNAFAGFFVFSQSFPIETNDYFPLLPFLGFFLIGASLSELLYSKKVSLMPKVNKKLVSPLTFLGRYSLVIYLAAQIVFFVILGIVSLIVTGTVGFV